MHMRHGFCPHLLVSESSVSTNCLESYAVEAFKDIADFGVVFFRSNRSVIVNYSINTSTVVNLWPLYLKQLLQWSELSYQQLRTFDLGNSNISFLARL